MITIRRARAGDAAAIGAVHVAAWRSAYAGILPDAYLTRMSVSRQALHYDATIRAGLGVHVATASGLDLGVSGRGPRIIGFVTGGPAREGNAAIHAPMHGPMHGLGDGEIQTLYVLDDWRDRGIGRRLMRAAAAHLVTIGCRSAFLWVLRDNPSRWFYTRLGGKPVAEATVHVGGAPVVQTAYGWAPIERLAEATSKAS
ncbi:MAG: GNAT family N-acetyltransferase [Acetobacteraceae bacterium]|nr:GNAT family N-acetyltransferase [Acetobacteraceae bacterium]